MADAELAKLREDLLHELRRDLTPQQGFHALECHQLLTVRFHRASRINAPATGERKGWHQFFSEHFPRGNEHAELLWVRWRNALVKDAYPGPGIAISHGQAHAHWQVSGAGLFINLESMWGDYEQSIDSMISMLDADDARRAQSLDWWRAWRWTVQRVHLPAIYLGGTVRHRLPPFPSVRRGSSSRTAGPGGEPNAPSPYSCATRRPRGGRDSRGRS
jgi:hypothetical protein